MLVLTRKEGESIVLGDASGDGLTLPDGTAVRVTVTAVRGGRVRLGIEAPPHVTVRRSEAGDPADRRPRPTPAKPAGRAAVRPEPVLIAAG